LARAEQPDTSICCTQAPLASNSLPISIKPPRHAMPSALLKIISVKSGVHEKTSAHSCRASSKVSAVAPLSSKNLTRAYELPSTAFCDILL
jgi:hypothetical protein